MQPGRYLAQSHKLVTALRLADGASRLAAGLRRARQQPSPPRRILLANPAHLGDVLIATAVLPPLRRAFPDAEIGMLVGSWARHVVEGHPDIAHIHVMDNFHLNRAPLPLRSRLARHARTWVQALGEIRSVGYDVAIDLYFHWPNCIPLLWAAGIPRRIGYDSGGFGPLLTDPFPWVGGTRHAAQAQGALLAALDIAGAEGVMPWMSLPPLPVGPLPGGLRPGRYVVIHPGTGSPAKEWPPSHWRTLTRRLAADGHQIVFTGRGEREASRIAGIIQATPGALNFCNALTWGQLRQVVAGARLVVGVESMAGHLAAAEGTPFVGMYRGLAPLNWWRPLGDGEILTVPAAAPSTGPAEAGDHDPMARIDPDSVFADCRACLGRADAAVSPPT